MKSSWNDDKASTLTDKPVEMRAYTSRLLGLETGLVLHGGGNTSVKTTEYDFFGEQVETLHVKGSGWDLASIEPAGFSPVRMSVLLKLAACDTLSDTDMVREQRASMLNPNAPNPSVEAILHALIPFRFVDHSHSDAVVTLTNTAGGEKIIQELYGERVVVIPYVMPGFALAKAVREQTAGIDWSTITGLILMNHGVFTFHDDPKESYERMIRIVCAAEQYLKDNGAEEERISGPSTVLTTKEALHFARFRKSVSTAAGRAMLAHFDGRPEVTGFARRKNVVSLSTRGPVTPDHVIHTKRIAAILETEPEEAVSDFVEEYQAYFSRWARPGITALDPAPRWAVWPGRGTIAMGPNVKRMRVVRDIIQHTTKAIQSAECLGGWKALPEKDIFDVEYWELEQAKLKRNTASPTLAGKVALVTGAASGIGAATVRALLEAGAAVAALDISPKVVELYPQPNVLPIVCDVTHTDQMQRVLAEITSHFGGLDILISNAGSFPASQPIEEITPIDWTETIDLNLTSHQQLLTLATPYLKHGVDSAVVYIASKNVPAPGPGVAAYSAAKAGLTQFARVAALELGKFGIRVNILHPNAVFDTGIWSTERIEQRAVNYGLSTEEYKKNNVLGVTVTSKQVADLAVAMASPLFHSTTGAQVPIDGGNDRVI
jgi:rhamnose utilization protein RhaD (predicted bifunctional aldolase and dehydrogenase)/NAD(P)-dependent dehydrogenase (short-subunit alcohol dehydrogenase family)